MNECVGISTGIKRNDSKSRQKMDRRIIYKRRHRKRYQRMLHYYTKIAVHGILYGTAAVLGIVFVTRMIVFQVTDQVKGFGAEDVVLVQTETVKTAPKVDDSNIP